MSAPFAGFAEKDLNRHEGTYLPAADGRLRDVVRRLAMNPIRGILPATHWVNVGFTLEAADGGLRSVAAACA